MAFYSGLIGLKRAVQKGSEGEALLQTGQKRKNWGRRKIWQEKTVIFS
jgi:hypothetical protein